MIVCNPTQERVFGIMASGIPIVSR